MSEHITLEVPDVVIRLAQEKAQRTGLPMETVLAGWLERAALFDSEAEIPIYTPFFENTDEVVKAMQAILDSRSEEMHTEDNGG